MNIAMFNENKSKYLLLNSPGAMLLKQEPKCVILEVEPSFDMIVSLVIG